MTTRYAKLIKNDIVDGEGICVSLWTQFCPHRCPGCHNPGTWSEDGGIEISDNLIQEIIQAISANGVMRNFSVLGGEPLVDRNLTFVSMVVQEVRKAYPDIKIFVWTGYTYEQMTSEQQKVVNMCDILIDGPFILSQRDITLPFRGSANQRVIDVQATLKNKKIILYK